ncbi:asparagine synthase (glutamine-hydrolyzing) [Psychroserpens ponticola]|uniref:asparagine synthase (glutamine-hydrolyzing) n=1 Tax=Psychroserpens ponticola TaxID=2932268 RepID=A0ABY7S1D5_9FLAO|nr:asparagine synthase (glutamine-hydrolyzing) [Psychroserpens ponticola]WCO03097.1 asparagine synthase (glutamine-hydrolyzing) [Psychroserpens ponticola]
MCGIYGTTIKYEEHQVQDKLKRTAFRGPDKMGWQFYKKEEKTITFGHNRLSIIDLDPRSDQPFTYYDHIHIVFNGEIYNFRILKKELTEKGYSFNTTSDTEVLCAAYLEYGEKCVDHLNGMFAFVIYDEKKQELFGARDRLGQKPFYYYHNGLDFEFSSQLSSIQMFNDNLSVSQKSIGYYLAWGNVPEPYSIFNEIKKLPAGHRFTYNIKTGDFNNSCYWDIDYQGKTKFTGTYNDAKNELSDILDDAVSSRLFADVPVGVFLSGGVDSSLVAAVASKSSNAKVKTFSVKFNEAEFDESAYAQQVADHLKTDHNVIECNYNEGMSLIENFSHFYDEPFADSSAIPSMLLAKHTREQVTVALSGDGGDESFIGYQRYKWATTKSKLYDVPYSLRKLSSSVLKHVPNYKLKVVAEALKTKNRNTAYLSVMTGINLNYIQSDEDFRDVAEIKYLDHNNKNLLERVSDFDLKTYLNWDINTKVDRATMAYSLEARAPLLDHRIVDFARALPTDFKILKDNQKRILKDVLYQYVPEHIFDRPKAGFAIPFATWFREDLKDYVLSELDDESLKNIPNINIENVKFMIKQHMDGSWNRYPLIWKLIVLKQWLNKEAKGISIK